MEKQYRIRKLTPRECWRLMGFSDEDFNKAAEVNSNTHLYAQAGNAIVVNVLEEILKKMIPRKQNQSIRNVVIDDTYGYGGIRTYENYAPTLRSEREGLKIIEEAKENE